VSRLHRRSSTIVGLVLLVVVVVVLVSAVGSGRTYTLAPTMSCLQKAAKLQTDMVVERAGRSDFATGTATMGTLAVSLVDGKEITDSVSLGFYRSADEAGAGIGKAKAWRAQLNMGPSVDGNVLYHRGNVIVHWFDASRADFKSAVEHCLK
jgi:hypothetical protein